MELEELKREAERLNPDEQRKLIGFLVEMEIRRNDDYRDELTRRLDDCSPSGWLSLQEAERRLKTDGL